MSYIRSVTNNLKYGLPKLVLQKLPGFRSVPDNIKSVRNLENSPFKEDMNAILSNMSSPLKKAYTNTRDGIKSGKLLSDKDPMMEAMGFSMDEFDMDMSSFGEDDFSFDEDSFGDSDTESKPIKVTAVKNVKVSPVKVNNISMFNSTPLISGMEMQARVTDRASKNVIRAVNGTSIATFSLIQAQTALQKSFYEESGRHFSVIEGVMSSIESHISEKLAKLVELSEATAERRGIKLGSSNNTSVSTNSRSDIINSDGNFDIAKYFEILASRGKEMTKSDSTFGMFAAMMSQPINMAAESVIEKILSSEKFNPLKDLGKSIESLPTLFFSKLTELEKSDNPFIRGIAEFFNVKDTNPNASLAKFDRGPVAFDGITRKSIVEVIPALLSKIYSALKGRTDELVYDYEKGMFTTDGDILKEMSAKNKRSMISDNDVLVEKVRGTDFFRSMSFKDSEAFMDQFADRLGELGLSGKILGDDTDLGKGQINELISKIIKSSSVGDLAQINMQLANSSSHNLGNLTEAQRIALATSKSDINNKTPGANPSSHDSLMNTKNGVKNYSSGVLSEDIANDNLHINNTERYGEDLFEKKAPTLKNIAELPSKALAKISNTVNDAIGKFLFGRKRTIFREDGSVHSVIDGDKNGVLGKLSSGLDKVKGFLSTAIFGKDAFNEDGTPKDPNSFLKDKKSLFTNIKNGLMVPFKGLKNRLSAIGDSMSEFINTKILKPIGNTFSKIGTWFKTEFFSPVADYFKKKFAGSDDKKNTSLLDKALAPLLSATEFIRKKVQAGFEIAKEQSLKLFSKFSTFILGEKDGEGRKGGLFSGVINTFRTQLVNPAKQFFFGEAKTDDKGNIVEKEGLFRNLGNKLTSKIFEPVGKYFSNIGDKLNKELFLPIKDALFGKVLERDRNGNPVARKQGIISKIQDSFRKNIIDPTKKYFFGKEEVDKDGNVIQKAGLFSRMADSIYKAFNGGKEPPKDGKTFFQRGIDFLNEKVFAPIKSYFMDEENGVFTKVNKYFNEKVLNPVKKYLLGDKADNKVGVLNKIGTWFDEKMFKPVRSFFYGDEKEGKIGAFQKLETWFSEKISTPFKNYMFGEDGKSGLWGGIKTSVNDFFFGNEEKGQQGFYQRFLKPAVDFINIEIFEPFKQSVNEMWEGSKQFIKDSVVTPLKGTLQPFIVEMGIQLDNLKNWVFTDLKNSLSTAFKDGLGILNDGLSEAFGVNIKEYLKENILEPIKDTLNGIRKFIGNTLMTIIKMPVNFIKNTADELKYKHIMSGKGDYLSEEERERVLGKFSMFNDNDTSKAGKKTKAEKITKNSKNSSEATPANKGIFAAFKDIFKRTASEVTNDISETSVTVGNEIVKGNAEVSAKLESVTTKVGDKISEATDKLGEFVSEINPLKKGRKKKGIKGSESGITKNESSSIDEANNAFDDAKDIAKKVSKTEDKKTSITGKSQIERIMSATEKSAFNTNEIVSFLKNNLQGTGHDVARIADLLGARELGGAGNQKRRGFFGKLKDFITSPLKFLKTVATNMISGIWSAVTGFISEGYELVKTVGGKILTIATEIVKLPFTIANTVLKGFNKALEVLGPIFSTIGEKFADGLGWAIEKTGQVIAGAGEFIGTTLGHLGKFLTETLLPNLSKVTGALVKFGSSIIRTTFAMLSFVTDGIGRVFDTITGRNRKGTFKKLSSSYITGGHIDSLGKINDVVDVNVVGGSLDNVVKIGGKKSATSSLNENGGRSATEILAERKQNLLESAKIKVQENIEKFTGATAHGVDKIKTGFGKLLGAVMFIGSGIAAVGKIIADFWIWRKMIEVGKAGMDFLGDSGNRRRRAGGAIRRGKEGIKTLGSKVGGMAASAGNFLKSGVGLGAIAGIGGMAINSYADNNMEDGLAKTAVKTVGTAASWAGTGAMIGSVIPGLGTAAGAIIGGIGGALYEVGPAAAKYIKEGIGNVVDNIGTAITAPFKLLGKAGSWIKDKVTGAGEFISEKITKVGEGFANIKNSIKDFMSNIVTKSSELLSNSAIWLKNKITSAGEFVHDKFKKAGEYVSEGFSKIKNGVLNAKDKVASFFGFGKEDESNSIIKTAGRMGGMYTLGAAGFSAASMYSKTEENKVQLQSHMSSAVHANEMKERLNTAESKMSSNNYSVEAMVNYLAQIAINTAAIKDKDFVAKLDLTNESNGTTNNKNTIGNKTVNIVSANNIFTDGKGDATSVGGKMQSRTDSLARG